MTSVTPLIVNNEGPWTEEETHVWMSHAVPLKRTVRCYALVREPCVLKEVVVPEEFVTDWYFRYLPSGFHHAGTMIEVDVVRLGKSENCKFTIVGERVPAKHFSELWSMDHLFMMGRD